MPLTFHTGQLELQDEANTRPVAERLAAWEPPVDDFTTRADLILLATAPGGGDLSFVCVSGRPPLIEVTGAGSMLLPALPLALGETGVLAGGHAIDLARARRARINGRLLPAGEGRTLLRTAEEFLNCRKYIVPSVALDERLHVGPEGGERVAYDDPWLGDLLAKAETAFLASVSPDGQPDVSHRGGAPGALRLDAESGRLSWYELVGNGMFKSAGNVRATGKLTLLVLDLQTGDAAELSGRGTYRTLHTYAEARTSGLDRRDVPYPAQGEMTVELTRATRLEALTWPRQRVASRQKVTCDSPLEDQSPR